LKKAALQMFEHGTTIRKYEGVEGNVLTQHGYRYQPSIQMSNQEMPSCRYIIVSFIACWNSKKLFGDGFGTA